MSLPEFVAPVATYGSRPGLLPMAPPHRQALTAIAVPFMSDQKHRESCLKVIRLPHGHVGGPHDLR